MKGKLNTRLGQNAELFEKGLLFANELGEFTDLSDLTVLNISVDTIKQLYSGTIPKNIMYALSALTEDGYQVLEKDVINNEQAIQIRGFKLPFDCHVSKMGKNSGYRYKLQNTDIGIVILIGSYYKQPDQETSHLKIELSPKFIASKSPSDCQKVMDEIAELYLLEPTPCAVSPHICVDVQGWELPLHMADDIITRSRYIRTYQGVDKVEFKDFDNVISMFGRAETLMVGRANSVQLAVYRKDLEIVKKDTVDYWHAVWSDFSMGSFNKDKPVTRIEYRFHHSIIQEFERGTGEDIKNFIELSQYLNNLWQYGLDTIKYKQNNYIAPFWQFLYEDITFNSDDLRQSFKREQKQIKQDITAITRNIGLFVGNYLSIRARSRASFRKIHQELKAMKIYHEIKNYLYENEIDESIYFQTLEHRYLEKLTISKAVA